MTRQLSPECAERLLGDAGVDRSLAAGTPLIILASDEPAVVWINQAATRLFGTERADAFERQLFRPSGAGFAGFMSRLSRARTDGEPYLERVTLPGGLRRRIAVFSVSAVSHSDQTFALLRGLEAVGAPDDPPFSYASALAGEASAADGHMARTEAAASPAADAAQPVEREHSLRLLWEARADGTVTRCDGRISAVLGTHALRVGDNVSDKLAEVDANIGATVAQALAESRNLGSLRFVWPGKESTAAIPVDLGFAHRPSHPAEIRGFLKVYSDRALVIGDGAEGEPPHSAPQNEEPESLPPPSTLVEPSPDEDMPAQSTLPDNDVSSEPAMSDRRPASLDQNGDHGSVEFGRNVPTTAFGNIVHFRSFKGATIHAAFGESLSPTKPAWLKVPDPPPPSRPIQDDSFESPVWAESPDAAAVRGTLSPDERTAFDEIGRTLGASQIGSTGDTSVLAPMERPSDEVVTGSDVDKAADTAAHDHGGEGRTAPDQEFLDVLPVGIAIRQDGRLVFLNRTLLDWLGLASLAEAGARDAGSDPDDLPGPVRGDASDVVQTLMGVHGRSITVETRTAPVIWNGRGAILSTLVPAASAEDARAMPEPPIAVVGAALEMACDGVAILDSEGAVRLLSPKAEQLLGVPGEALAGDSAAVLFMADEEMAWATLLESLPEGEEASVRGSLQARTPSGPVSVRLVVARLESRHLALLVWDETERLRAEQDLVRERGDADRANALKSEFLAKVSHEIRTPLNAILGFAEVIMEERFGPIGTPRYIEYLRDIHASGTHVMSLVNDLLDLSRIEAGRLELRLGPVDVNALINECVGTLQPQAHRERVIVRSSLASRLPLAQADERTFRQIILNLLSNAVKFNEPGGQVIVSTAARETGDIAIRIRDTGIGMSESEIELAMEPFRQLATAKVPGGTGLGLPLTKALVEASRATMTIKSRVGEGTLIEIVFPASGSEPLSIPAE